MITAGRWRVDDPHESIWLARRSPWSAVDTVNAGVERLSADAAVARLGSWFPAGWIRNDGLLAEICLSLEGVFPGGCAPDGDWLHGTVRRALLDGRLIAFRMPFPAPVEGFAKEEEEPPAPPREVREEKTWIEIALVDDGDPPQPMAFKRYRIELPDGSVREGMLDQYGAARLEGIEPGECLVSFPDFDGWEWPRF